MITKKRDTLHDLHALTTKQMGCAIRGNMIQTLKILIGHKLQIKWEMSVELVYKVIRDEVL